MQILKAKKYLISVYGPQTIIKNCAYQKLPLVWRIIIRNTNISQVLVYKIRLLIKLMCRYLMAKKWVEARRISELVDGAEP